MFPFWKVWFRDRLSGALFKKPLETFSTILKTWAIDVLWQLSTASIACRNPGIQELRTLKTKKAGKKTIFVTAKYLSLRVRGVFEGVMLRFALPTFR